MSPNPLSPHHEMKMLDEEGTAYWIEGLLMTSGAFWKGEVLHHSPEWLHLAAIGETLWINMDHVVSMRIVSQ